MGGLVILFFIYGFFLIVGAFVSNPDIDAHAEEKIRKYYQVLHIIMGILAIIVIGLGAKY